MCKRASSVPLTTSPAIAMRKSALPTRHAMEGWTLPRACRVARYARPIVFRILGGRDTAGDVITSPSPSARACMNGSNWSKSFGEDKQWIHERRQARPCASERKIMSRESGNGTGFTNHVACHGSRCPTLVAHLEACLLAMLLTLVA